VADTASGADAEMRSQESLHQTMRYSASRIATPYGSRPAGLDGARERVRELAAARGLGALPGTAA